MILRLREIRREDLLVSILAELANRTQELAKMTQARIMSCFIAEVDKIV